MEQNTYFSFRCPGCGGKARVASRHAGQAIVCPHCQAHHIARPDVRPTTLPSATAPQPVSGNPATTTRVARPFDTTTSTVRRAGEATELIAVDPQSASRTTAPGMAGFTAQRPQPAPGTAAVQRRPAGQAGTATIQRVVHVAPSPRSPLPLAAAFGLAVLCAGIAVWAFTEANFYRRLASEARDQQERSIEELVVLKVRAESQERRLAQAQVELAAQRAATTRERELVADLQKTIGKLGEELARATRPIEPGLSTVPTIDAVTAVTASGAFPSPDNPAAGVPAIRRDQSTIRR